MIIKKKFDCVQMKWEIQQKLIKESSGISNEKFNDAQLDKISKNTSLAQFLKKVKKVKKSKDYLVPA